MCKKHQTIAEATAIINMAPIERGARVIVNIGVADLLNGMTTQELMDSFEELMKLCAARGLKPIIFYLVPYKMCDLDGLRKVNKFNEHLKRRYDKMVHHFQGWSSEELGEILSECLPR